MGALGALAALVFSAFLIWATRPGPSTGRRVVLDWPPGLDATASAQHLAAAGLITSPRLFALYLRMVHVKPDAGPHIFNDTLSPRSLVQRLGRMASRPRRRVTIPEGFDQWQVAARLERKEICSSASFLAAVDDPRWLARLGISGPSAEGYLFPATYLLRVDSPPGEVVRRFVGQTRRRLRKLAREHPGALTRLKRERGWGVHEVLTLASIIEKEAAHSDEDPIIASVYFNRLSDPDFRPLHTLGADPTAAYGCLLEGDRVPSCAGFSGRVTPTMLRDARNPYNTYKHPGLPPGPIANPGEAAIAAVLEPANTPYLFFVATGGGRHTFTRTLREHDRAMGK